MALVDELSARIADAMRKHDAVRLSTLRMLKAALMNREIERGRALDQSES
ncbi:MAG: GatB/YqeY domain-containing protein, partial [Vicinamibacterales bacterium]